MRARLTIAFILGLGFLTACGGSGGGGGTHATGEVACSGADCGHDTTVPAAPLACGGASAATCPQGYRCSDQPSDTCDPSTGGVDCGGTCVLGEELPRCGRLADPPCAAGSVCVDDANDMCAGGQAIDCPGICRPKAVAQCSTDADCPMLDHAACSPCADGSVNCPRTTCDAGQCTMSSQPCPGPQACGGVSGVPCAPGFSCVDDPADGCAPNNGGADCPGICVPEQKPIECSGITGGTCPPGLECVDDPNDTCDPKSGADCPGLCQPSSGTECVTDADCPQLRAPCSVCADGSEACPQSFCGNGVCTVAMPSCPIPPPVLCADDGGCKPGEVCILDPNSGCDPTTGTCKGTCNSVNQPRPCGGILGATCPDGYTCVADLSAGCAPDANGADCPGVCQPSMGSQCMTDADCPQLRAPCSVCADGNEVCPRSSCGNGVCTVAIPSCPIPPPVSCGDEGGCKPGDVCVLDPNSVCDAATGTCKGICTTVNQPRPCGGILGATCPDGYTCVNDGNAGCAPDANGNDCPGVCKVMPPPQCRMDSDCVSVQAPCTLCPDGSYTCPQAACKDGACTTVFGACTGSGFCGGIAGFPCPPGSTCVDDPKDDCDPKQGGADCGGVCVREEQPPPCGGLMGTPCPEGLECTDDPRDDCNPNTGGADCPGICRAASSSKCATDADCPLIGAPCRLCADGTAACPRSFCDAGQCQAEFPTCKNEP